MEPQIPQTFKVQWLNTTLKFIKDDTQLVKDYPKMPSSHVEYLHNLIWQRKNDVGLGFKSLYSPVWEAMKIYSVKYKFKVVVNKSQDGMTGHLIMEKIPKAVQPVEKVDDKSPCFIPTNNNDEGKESNNGASQNYDVIKESQKGSVNYKIQEPQPSKKSKTKKASPQVSRGLKVFIEIQKNLDSLSPLFIKSTLKLILDFITDELSASKIFSNLAPVESKFLENFLNIYQRRNDLQDMLSPACNDMLSEISICFDNFSKTCRLDISTVGVNQNTNKREIKYTKVPVFPSKKKAKQKLKELSTQPMAHNNTKKLVNLPSISKEEHNIKSDNNVLKETNRKKIQNETKILQNIANKYNNADTKLKDEIITTIENNVLGTLSKFVKKTNNDNIKTSPTLKNKSLNKSVLSPKKSINLSKEETTAVDSTPLPHREVRVEQKSLKIKIPQDTSIPSTTAKSLSVLLPKKSISFTKEGTSDTIETPYIRPEQKKPKMKILQDMAVPLTSDKGLRMMQLMGWKGGALGLRGDGITEPIIPNANFNGSGLGHVSVKKDSNKEKKKQILTEFGNKILEMIDNDINLSVIKLHDKLIKREIRFWKLTLAVINKRMNLDVEFDNGFEIKDKMIRNPNIMFNIDFEDDNRQIRITKTSKTGLDKEKKIGSEDIDTNAIHNPKTKETLNIIVLKSVLELLQSEDNEKVIKFHEDCKEKLINFSNNIIHKINKRRYVKQKNILEVSELCSQIFEVIGDTLISIRIYESEKYIVMKKKHPSNNGVQKNNQVVVNEAKSTEDNKSAFDNVRSNLPTKKKHKLLNALYQYEVKYPEEFKENQWYKTSDNSLLESKDALEDINNYTATINNNTDEAERINENNKNNIDQNNNDDLRLKFS